eukprot:TRINITY_DN71786_c0_g1_i1.p1 TRINITY_DN71786_c0_g1~~TRINITY_DN71786_c0_g1_i1.p1  ORF type:complete len:137 (+),score=20.49 TRINITY_DN71786_c0_g1_i1:43-411(+)
MTGRKPHKIFQFCWIFVSPVLISVIWVFTLIDYKTPSYNGGAYTYPWWCILLGWFITSLSILPIPILAMVAVARSKGTNLIEKFRNSFVSKINACPCCESEFDSKMQAHVHKEPGLEMKTKQ